MGDYCVVCSFDYGGERAKGRRDGLISVWEKTRATSANEVIGWRGVDCCLDVWRMLVFVRRQMEVNNGGSLTCSVEVVVWSCSERRKS